MIEKKSHGEGIRGRDHMYSSESFWRLCGNTCKKSQRENKVDNERTIIQRRDDAHIVRLATVQMEKADR